MGVVGPDRQESIDDATRELNEAYYESITGRDILEGGTFSKTDGRGGWSYEPLTGKVKPNLKGRLWRYGVWWPFRDALEDPSRW